MGDALRAAAALHGDTELLRDLQAMQYASERADMIKEGLIGGAQGTLQRAQELCPAHTGQLRSSLRVEAHAYGNGQAAAEIISDPNYMPGRDDYMNFVEFGTAHVPARPFLRPAFDETEEQAAQTIFQLFTERLKQEFGFDLDTS